MAGEIKQSADSEMMRLAAERMDWTQVMLNYHYGPPCFHLEAAGTFCGRAKTWAGHTDADSHAFVSLADLVSLIRQQTAARCAEMPLTIPPKHTEERGTAAHLRDQIRAEFEVGKVATNAD